VLTPAGRLVIVGGENGDWIGPLLTPLKAAIINPFVDQELISFTASMTRQDIEVLANMMAEGQLQSVIGQRYPLEDIREAMALSESGRARGKIIVEVSEPADQ
jgi:NADPH:quinone reductase-like Zn-dependent oxidoreductase